MKKIIKVLTTSLICLCMVVSCGFLLSGCNKSKNNASARLNSVSDMYGFAAMTTGLALVQNQETSSSQTFLAVGAQTASLSEQEIVAVVDKYIGIFESVVGGKTPVSTEKAESDKPEYETKLIVRVNNLAGEESIINIYFNETASVVTTDDFDDPDDWEVNTTLVGLMEIDNREVAITGVKTIENDEIEITFTAELDGQRVVFNQEVENGEQEFSYEVYQGQSKVEEFSFELEVERNEVEVEFLYRLNGVTYAYEIEEETRNGVRYLEIYYQEGSSRNNIEVSIRKDGDNTIYVYKLKDGTTIERTK